MRILGKDIVLHVDGTMIGLSTSCVIDVNLDVAETASADARAKAFKAGRYSYTLAIDKLYDGQGEGSDGNRLLAYQLSGTVVDFTIAHTTEGDYMSGQALITNTSINAPAQGYATHRVNMQGTGALTI